MICFFGLLIQLCLITPCLLRILLGPLSTTLCWWQVFFSQFLSISYMVVFCTNYMARYFYVVVYKTATICNDDFIGFFTFIEILTMGFGFSLLHNISPGKFAINYYVCQGIDPESDTTGIFIYFISASQQLSKAEQGGIIRIHLDKSRHLSVSSQVNTRY